MNTISFEGNIIRCIYSHDERYLSLSDVCRSIDLKRSSIGSLSVKWADGIDKIRKKIKGQNLSFVSLIALKDIVKHSLKYSHDVQRKAYGLLEYCRELEERKTLNFDETEREVSQIEVKPMERSVAKVSRIEPKPVEELPIKEYKGQRVVTFKDIDEVHGRAEGTAGRNFSQHKEKLIENEDYFVLQGNEARVFAVTNFVDANVSKLRTLTVLTESGYLMLVKSFTDDLAWEVQRNIVKTYFKVKQNNQLALPQSYEEALEQLLKSVKNQKALETKNLMLEQQVKEAEPKLTYVDTILESKNAVLISQIAKDYGLSGRALNKILHEEGVQYKVGSQWLLYSKHQDKGYTKSRTYIDSTGEPRMHTLWTQKGRLFIHELLSKRGIVALLDREKPDAPTSDR